MGDLMEKILEIARKVETTTIINLTGDERNILKEIEEQAQGTAEEKCTQRMFCGFEKAC